jgi:hypothetical protein
MLEEKGRTKEERSCPKSGCGSDGSCKTIWCLAPASNRHRVVPGTFPCWILPLAFARAYKFSICSRSRRTPRRPASWSVDMGALPERDQLLRAGSMIGGVGRRMHTGLQVD